MSTFSIKFAEAIAYAEKMEVVLPDIFYATGNMRARTTTVSGLASLSQIKYVIDQLNKVIADGKSLDDFKQMVRTGDIKIKLPDYRLDTIYRTNIQTAYSYGRFQQQLKVIDTRPYWMYDAVNDSRTRPTHRALDNVIALASSSFWKTHYPPLGYNCRCAVISLTQKQAEDRGVTQELPLVNADNGFGYNVFDFENSLNSLFEETVTKYEIEYANISSSLAKLQKQVLESKQAEFKLKGLLNHSMVSGPFKEQYLRILRNLGSDNSDINGLSVRLFTDYITDKSYTIKNFLQAASTQVSDLLVANWIKSAFSSIESSSLNTVKNIYSGISENNKYSLLTVFEEGAIVQIVAPMSYTSDFNIATMKSGANGVVLHLDNAQNTGIDVLKTGANTLQAINEKEVIILSGTNIEVNKVEHKPDGSTHVYANITTKDKTKDF